MKIIILHPHFAYSRGASRFVLEVAERLAERGKDVLVVAIMADQELLRPYPHLKFHFLGGPKTDSIFYWLSFPLFQWRLHRFLNRIPEKILFPQVMPANWWAFIYKKFHQNVSVIWMCHEPSAFVHSLPVIESLDQPFKTIIKLLRPLLAFFDKRLVCQADQIITNSVYAGNLIWEIYGRNPAAIAYPGVDIDKFKPSDGEKEYIFALSRLDRQKGIDSLIKAYAKLSDTLKSKNSLVIGGEGREKNGLVNLVRKLKIEKSVKFLGVVSENKLPGIYAKAKLVVFPAIGEPLGMVPLEAMASGVPVIANRGGGTEETVINGQTGFLIESAKPKLLAAKMSYLLLHKNVLEKMGGKARQHIKNNFSWDKTVRILEKFFNVF